MGKEHSAGAERYSLTSFAQRVKSQGAVPLLGEFKSEDSPYALKKVPMSLPGGQSVVAEYFLSKGFAAGSNFNRSTSRPTICILPGIFESVYSYMPTVQALEADYNVVVVNYAQFPDLQTQAYGTKKILEENLGVENVFFYGTSLGGLLMQHTALAIANDPESALHVKGIIGSHTVDINYRSLADPRYRALSKAPAEVLWIGLNLLNLRRAKRNLNDTLAGDATDDEILGHYFSQATNAFKSQDLASNKEVARHYLNLFLEAATHTHRRQGRVIDTSLLNTVPKLDIYSDGDTVLKRHRGEGGLTGDRVIRHKLKGESGHYNHKLSHMEIISKISEFVSSIS